MSGITHAEYSTGVGVQGKTLTEVDNAVMKHPGYLPGVIFQSSGNPWTLIMK